mgnify:CR=1 FL=1
MFTYFKNTMIALTIAVASVSLYKMVTVEVNYVVYSVENCDEIPGLNKEDCAVVVLKKSKD